MTRLLQTLLGSLPIVARTPSSHTHPYDGRAFGKAGSCLGVKARVRTDLEVSIVPECRHLSQETEPGIPCHSARLA